MIYNATDRNNSLAQSFAVQGWIFSADFSDNGHYLAVGDKDKYIYIY